MTAEQMMAARDSLVLAPHFSCILRGGDNTSSYYILGQSPIGGGTTLRMVTAEGVNCNLGPGPNPTLIEFHQRLDRELTGNTE